MELVLTIVIGSLTLVANEIPNYLDRRHEAKQQRIQAYTKLCLEKDICKPLYQELDIQDEQRLQTP